MIVARPAKDTRLVISHLCYGLEPRSRGPAIIPEDTFVVLLHLADCPHRTLSLQRDRPDLLQGFSKGSIIIVNLNDGVFVEICKPLDALSICIPRATLDAFTDHSGYCRITSLTCAPATIDPVLAGLGAAMLPALKQPLANNRLVTDRIGLAMLEHMAAAFGSFAPTSRRSGGLTRYQAERAQRYLIETETTDLSLAEAAATCGLSRGYFSKAFKVTTGCSPSRWLLEHRINKAKHLLRGPDPIAEIAVECGFTDQSHFTRMFTHVVGIPPGLWRRQQDCLE